MTQNARHQLKVANQVGLALLVERAFQRANEKRWLGAGKSGAARVSHLGGWRLDAGS